MSSNAMKPFSYFWLAAAALGLQLSQSPPANARTIPTPAPDHPGNIFLAGERVHVPCPFGENANWRAVDYDGKTVATGRIENGGADLGQLPVGFYEVFDTAEPGANHVCLGVLRRLKAPTPLTSPICIDVAMAWFYPPAKMKTVANLCALAGINSVRDRLNWAEMEPERGRFSGPNRYDASARAQSQAGLQVLQVMHRSPAWANPDTRRFPLDLRDIFNFDKAMAQRWRNEVVAFEPWNEADIKMFGGHTGSEMASLQKAAYLGLKVGNPNVIACWNVFATHRASTLRDMQQNRAWPYFDTFDLHHYEPFANYSKLYADFRAVSAGRPLWVTECSVPVKWHGDPRLQEPTPQDLRIQSERVAKTYALAVHEGAKAVFYFLLPHYVEGQTQFGILHRDLTPRPAYVALAAAGRLLADARPVGGLRTASPSIHGYLFRAKPDGASADVLVIWSDHDVDLELPETPIACSDHLGRGIETEGRRLRVTPAPKYVLFSPGAHFDLAPSPATPPFLPGKPSPIVLQALLPERTILLSRSAYRLPAIQSATISIYGYNFGKETVHGHLEVKTPTGCRVRFPEEVTLQPGDRKELSFRLTCNSTNTSVITLGVVGHFGAAGKAVLSLRLIPNADLAFLRGLARDVVQASRVPPGQSVGRSPTNTCGFTLIMPGGRGGYPAFWIRDFAMSLDSGLITPQEMFHHLRLIAQCQNGPVARKLKHGLLIPPFSIPDHINFDGTAVFYPGTYSSGEDQGAGAYGILPPVDDHYEFVHIAYCLFRAAGKTDFLEKGVGGMTLFDRLVRAFDSPRSDPATGLVATDDAHRAVGFGFCDTVYLTGDLLFPSLLRFRAAGELAELCNATGRSSEAAKYREMQQRISASLVPTFAEPARIGGWLLAATKIGRQPDVWGTAYALNLGVLQGVAAERAARTIADGIRRKTIVFEGGVRHVPTDFDFSSTSAWERTAGVGLNTYQNGAYWDTPTGWLIAAIDQADPQTAEKLLADYIQHLRKNDFRRGPGHGAPWECFGPDGYAQNGVYMTSVTLPLAVLSGQSRAKHAP